MRSNQQQLNGEFRVCIKNQQVRHKRTEAP